MFAVAALFAVPSLDARTIEPAYRAPVLPDADHFSTGGTGQPVASTVCERMGVVADRLGETYAGHRVRASLVEHQCPLTHAAAARKVWDWPWRALDQTSLAAASPAGTPGAASDDDLLPPLVRRDTGAWQLRCGRAPTRERCALTQRERDGATPLDAHFVIDRIAGKSAVLFRLFVPAPPADFAAAMLEVPDRTLRLAVTACTPRGCMFEATPALSSVILDRLFDGQTLSVRFVSLDTVTSVQPTSVSAAGFRDGFRELLQMDRTEARR